MQGSQRNGSLYRCADGTLIEPLDFIHLLMFPNKGWDATGDNVCFQPRHFELVEALRGYLPGETGLFTPGDLLDALLALLLAVVIVTLGFVVVKYTWERFDKQYDSISPSHKKWYVVANMFKALLLGAMALSPKYWMGIYKCNYLDECQLTELKRSMALYVTIDIVALYMVPKLPCSTIIHHVTTTAFSFLVYSLNIRVKGLGGVLGPAKMCIMYGAFSTIPYLVNAYLALRIVYPKSKLVKVLCHMSLVTYSICCALNWSVHSLWILGYWGERELSIYTVFYVMMVVFIIQDDIVLMKWLYRQSSPMAEDRRKAN